MTLALLAALVMVSVFAAWEGVLIRRLTADAAIIPSPPPPVLANSAETNNAIVELVCESLSRKSEQWTFENGVVTHTSGLTITTARDGLGVVFRKDGTTAVVDGIEAARIREAIIARNLRASFSGIVEHLT